MSSIAPVRVTKTFGRTLDNLEMLWFIRDQAERRLAEHMSGNSLSADEWAAVNTPDDAWKMEQVELRPKQSWKVIKDEWMAEGTFLAELAERARKNVRIATGHEPIGKMVCRQS